MYSQQRGKRGGGYDSTGESSAGSSHGYEDDSPDPSTRSRKSVVSSSSSSEVILPYDRDMLMRLISGRLEQIGVNLDQDVRQYVDIPSTDLMPYRVRRVVSPFEFYMELAVWSGDLNYSKWFPEMQEFYKDPKNQEKFRVVSYNNNKIF